MKKLLTLFAAIAMLFVASCGGDDYDDTALRNELTDLANRVAKLEQLCQQMNTNISSLQTIVNALQQNDFITAVVPVTQGGKVIGYTITFSRSGAITIYHGSDGADGKDGSTPQISVKQDSDGIYYWTLNGEWLLDANGNKIQANGVHGTTPQFKIENEYWYVSYDDGETWNQLGKAINEGSDDWHNIIESVTQDDEYVYIALIDGSVILLPKDANHNNGDNIMFIDPVVKAICCANWDTDGNSELSYEEASAISDIQNIFNGWLYVQDRGGRLVSVGNPSIFHFGEFKYFTNVKELPTTAFANNINMQDVTLPPNLEYIRGTEIFMIDKYPDLASTATISITLAPFMNTLITSITLPETVISIGSEPFYGAKHLKTIYCKSITPPALYNGLGVENCRIMVPRVSVEAYKTADYWNHYATNIEPYDFD